jgi:hypothetical protein
MRPCGWLAAAPIALIPLGALAQEVTVTPGIGYQGGSSSYQFDFSVQDPDTGDVYEGRSRLAWPMDYALVDVQLALRQPSLALPWELRLEAATNLGNPRGTMVDDDWVGMASQGIPLQQFSHTDSSTELRAIVIDAGVWLYVTGGPAPWKRQFPWGLAVGVGYRHQHLSYDGYGATGWQDLDGTGHQYASLPSDVLAISYRFDRAQPYLGMRLPWNLGRVDLQLEARAAVVRSLDIDDHVLRNKRARGTAWGGEASGAFTTLVRVTDRGQSPAIRLGGRAEIALMRTAEGTWSQAYYADDPSFDGNQLGTSLPDVRYYVTSTRVTGLLTVEAAF